MTNVVDYNTVMDTSRTMVDTFIIFDPETGIETLKIVSSKKEVSEEANLDSGTPQTGIDTVITFDPETEKEVMIVIDHSTGKSRAID